MDVLKLMEKIKKLGLKCKDCMYFSLEDRSPVKGNCYAVPKIEERKVKDPVCTLFMGMYLSQNLDEILKDEGN